MSDERVVEYLGREIRIIILAPKGTNYDTFTATYRVVQKGASNSATRGTITGVFHTADDAANAALRAARSSVSEH